MEREERDTKIIPCLLFLPSSFKERLDGRWVLPQKEELNAINIHRSGKSWEDSIVMRSFALNLLGVNFSGERVQEAFLPERDHEWRGGEKQLSSGTTEWSRWTWTSRTSVGNRGRPWKGHLNLGWGKSWLQAKDLYIFFGRKLEDRQSFWVGEEHNYSNALRKLSPPQSLEYIIWGEFGSRKISERLKWKKC